MKLITKSDIIFTVIIAAAALAVFFAFNLAAAGSTVVITQNGQTVGEYPLSQNNEITVSGEYENVIAIKDGEARVLRSSCKNQVCVKSGGISKAGQSIVCAPNGVVVLIKGESEIDGISQ